MNSRYSRPTGQPAQRPASQAAWMGAEERWQGGRSPYQRPAWQEEPAGEETPFEPPYEEEAFEELPPEPSRRDSQAEMTREIIATNRTVLLTCTLAAMMGLFAVFLCFAEKRSRAIRHFAGQSAALTGAHVALALTLALIGGLLGAIPLLGFLLRLVCWLLYIAVFIVLTAVRIRMMFFAYQGIRFTLPFIGEKISERMGV